jgi:hypothetical protein
VWSACWLFVGGLWVVVECEVCGLDVCKTKLISMGSDEDEKTRDQKVSIYILGPILPRHSSSTHWVPHASQKRP